MNVDLAGKVTIITGAGSGIGAELARRFANEGARLFLLDRVRERLMAVDESLRASTAEVLIAQCDVSRAEQVEAAVADCVKHFGTVDVLINNAGVAPEMRIEEMDADTWDAVYATNCRGVFLFSRAVLPFMKKARRGRILNAASFAAVIPSVGYAAYSASKSAVITFTRVLAAEVGPWEITANAYVPGMIPTDLNGFAVMPTAKQERLLNTLSLRRWGSADDIASLLLFLASEHASYITGAAIEITGGKYSVQFPQLSYELM